MASIHTRCDGVFIGQALGSQFDASTQVALQLSESLLELKSFDGSDVMSRYLYLYHTKRCNMGATTIAVCQKLKDNIINNRGRSSISREDFLFDQSLINETVKLVHDKQGGFTAGCGPAHRSFPLALCPWIKDEDLLDISIKEAALTHYSPLAGQVAGIVNLICRSLLKNNRWHEAVQSAFLAPCLHADLIEVYTRYIRYNSPNKVTHPAYAPTALNTALHYITNSSSVTEATEKAYGKDKHYCVSIVGILSGALWGIPLEMYKDKTNDTDLKTIRDTANKLSSQWSSTNDIVHA